VSKVSRARFNPSEQLWSHFKGRTQNESNPALRNQIAVQLRNMVRKEAHSYKERCAVPYEDLEQIGTIGLLKAIDKFDPTMGVAFTSFAIPYIRGEILHHLRDHGSTVKVPRRMRETYSKAKGVERRWTVQTGKAPTEQELAEQVGCTVERLQFIRGAIANQMAMSLIDEICEIPSPPETAVEDQERQQHLEQAWSQLRHKFSNLPPNEKDLVRGVYFSQLSQKTIRQYGNTTERLRGILRLIS